MVKLDLEKVEEPEIKLEVVKQEVARLNITILGISELKWKGMDAFNSVQFSSVQSLSHVLLFVTS